MTRRKQKLLEGLLGAVTAAVILVTIFHWRGENRSHPVIFQTLSLNTEQTVPFCNINTATEEQLQSLPGIGEVLAGRIVAWREENGPFQSSEDVMAVKGIGTAIYESISPYITY
jgi:competence protein ComEA